jgi:hypothetical protein
MAVVPSNAAVPSGGHPIRCLKDRHQGEVPKKVWRPSDGIDQGVIWEYQMRLGAMGERPWRERSAIVMRERGAPDSERNYDDPDAEPWTALALVVVLALICLILIARFALAVISG